MRKLLVFCCTLIGHFLLPVAGKDPAATHRLDLAEPEGAGSREDLSTDELNNRMNELYEEMQAVDALLNEIHDEARRREAVAGVIERYEIALQSEMVSLAPELAPIIEEHHRMAVELRKAHEPSGMTFRQRQEHEEKAARHQHLTLQLQPIRLEAQRNKIVAEYREASREKLQVEMRRVDPTFEALMERRSRVFEEFNAVQRELLLRQHPRTK